MPTPPKPDAIDKVNYIIDAWEQPCHAPWLVYVETLAPAALELFVSLENFDPLNIVRSFARPKGLRSGRHGRAGIKGGRGLPSIPDWNDMVGEYFREATGVGERHYSDGVRHLWIILGVAERLLWYWMVADLALEFFYTWTSLIYETGFCQKANEAGAYYQQFNIGILGGQGDLILPMGDPQWIQGAITALPGGSITSSVPLQLHAAINFLELQPPSGGHIQVGIYDATSGARHMSSRQHVAFGSSTTCVMANGPTVPGHEYFIIANADDGFGDIVSAEWIAHG